MSVQATTWVWEHSTATGTNLIVLLSIADAANREGEESCQSVATIARMARVSEATAHRAKRWLAAAGEIEECGTNARYRGTIIYRLPGVRGVTLDTPGVSPEPKRGVITVTPDPKRLTPEEHNPPTPLPRRPIGGIVVRKGAPKDLGHLNEEQQP